MSRSARLVVRVVFVPGAGAADARRRVAEVLLRAASAADAPSETRAPETPANHASPPPREKAA
ncbi:MAG: hypothetical protein EXR69_10155 [Myxococcales bacterium]|nr:hypothetical protein [Myxococcales bacterium]